MDFTRGSNVINMFDLGKVLMSVNERAKTAYHSYIETKYRAFVLKQRTRFARSKKGFKLSCVII